MRYPRALLMYELTQESHYANDKGVFSHGNVATRKLTLYTLFITEILASKSSCIAQTRR